jgi:Protein of unknown function (DUF642)
MRVVRWSVGAGIVGTLVAGLVGSAAAAPNLIVNGSFETPDVPTGQFRILSSIPGWTFQPRAGATSTGIEIQDHVAGAPAAGAGNQFVELDANGSTRIFQDVATSAGSTYRLTFLYSPRPGTAAADNRFSVTAGPTIVEFGPLTAGAQTIWSNATVNFVATAAPSRIEFLDLGPSNGLGGYLDLVAVELINSPPACGGVAPSQAVLWPPNHKLRMITLAGATDPEGDPVAITVTGVTQDEPVNGRGDGNTSPDFVLGPAADQVQVRAERSGLGDGRVYTISFTAKDPAGASCSGAVTVSVPHDKRGGPGATKNPGGQAEGTRPSANARHAGGNASGRNGNAQGGTGNAQGANAQGSNGNGHGRGPKPK